MPVIDDDPIQDIRNQIIDVFNSTDSGKDQDDQIRKLFEELDVYTPKPLPEIPYIFGTTIKRPPRT